VIVTRDITERSLAAATVNRCREASHAWDSGGKQRSSSPPCQTGPGFLSKGISISE
jgi:hypothetical protein